MGSDEQHLGIDLSWSVILYGICYAVSKKCRNKIGSDVCSMATLPTGGQFTPPNMIPYNLHDGIHTILLYTLKRTRD